MDDQGGQHQAAAAIAPTYRFRRREVMKVRLTWLGMVFVLCLMTFRAITRGWPGLGMTGEVVLFIGVVVLPMLALALWRLGLLPPERVRVDAPPQER